MSNHTLAPANLEQFERETPRIQCAAVRRTRENKRWGMEGKNALTGVTRFRLQKLQVIGGKITALAFTVGV